MRWALHAAVLHEGDVGVLRRGDIVEGGANLFEREEGWIGMSLCKENVLAGLVLSPSAIWDDAN